MNDLFLDSVDKSFYIPHIVLLKFINTNNKEDSLLDDKDDNPDIIDKWRECDINKKATNFTMVITEQTFKKDVESWFKFFYYKESGVIIQFQDDCNLRIPEILRERKTLKNLFGSSFEKNKFVYQEVNDKSITAVVRNIIEESGQDNLRTNIILSHIKDIPSDKREEEFYELERLLRNNSDVSVLIFSIQDLTAEPYYDLINRCSAVFKNILKYPLYSAEDTKHFINIRAKKWNLILDEKTRAEIISQSGGYLWIVSQLLRNTRNLGTTSVDVALNQDVTLIKLKAIWDKFSKAEQEVLRKTALGILDPYDKRTHEYKHLEEIRFVKESEGLARLEMRSLNLVVDSDYSGKNISYENGKIYLNSEIVDDHFTQNEAVVLKLFLQSENQITTRDEIAKSIWGSVWNEKYSDWAIDKLVSRLRKRIESLGISGKRIKTVKSKGIIWEGG